MSKSNKLEFLKLQTLRVDKIKEDLDKIFYFLEADGLKRRKDEGSWSLIEVFEHLNDVNAHYLKHIRIAHNKAKKSQTAQSISHSFFGKWFANRMKPVDGINKSKTKAFKNLDPRTKRAKGIAVLENIVFKDILDDLTDMKNLLKDAEELDLSKAKVQSLISYISFKYADAWDVVLSHYERHMIQAKNIQE